MAAMKPRTGDGPMEAVKEGRLIIVRVPLEGGGRLVVSVNDDEAKELHSVLSGVVGAVAVPRARWWRVGVLVVCLLGQWWWIHEMLALGDTYYRIP